mgnify:CR=1 FL=1|jgi:hypothetical protein
MTALTCLEVGNNMKVKGTIGEYVIKQDSMGNLWTTVNGYSKQVKRNRGWYGWYKHSYGKVVVYPNQQVAFDAWSNLPNKNKCEVHEDRIAWYKLDKSGKPLQKFVKLGVTIDEY